MPVPRPAVVCQIGLLVALAMARLALLLPHPVPALAAAPCPASMALIPAGSERIGARAHLPHRRQCSAA